MLSEGKQTSHACHIHLELQNFVVQHRGEAARRTLTDTAGLTGKMDVLEHTPNAIHRVVRVREAGALPPRLRSQNSAIFLCNREVVARASAAG